MTKTPEQMAEEWANGESDLWFAEISTYTNGHKSAVKQGFLAGYQAAKDQFADADKVMPQWISVKERLPKEGEQIFVVYSGEHCKDVHLSCYENGWSSLIDVTHWMPLPEPPKQ